MRNKKWNKKATMLAMLLAMAMAFAACGGKDDAEKISGQITPISGEQDADTEEDVTPTEAADGQDTTQEDDAEEKKTTSLGRIQGGVYVNEYMEISCTLSEDWEFYTAEELQEMPENVAEMFEDTDLENQMSAMDYITDMSAENKTDMTSMNIIYQKMGLQDRLAAKNMSHEDVIDGTLSQKDFLIQSYAQAGINVTKLEKKTVEFCGEERAALWMESNVSGVAYYAVQIMDYSLGDYAVTMTLSSFVEDKTDDLLKLFAKYE